MNKFVCIERDREQLQALGRRLETLPGLEITSSWADNCELMPQGVSKGRAVKELAEKDGHKVIMTRDDDRLLGDTESGAIRSKKTADLIERKRIIDESKADFAVSIHLNSFKGDRSVHGAQVFYPQGKEDEKVIADSKMLAEAVYEKISLGLDDGTNRPVLAKGDARILKNVSVPTIIVECGFLSNNKEAELLESEEYQEKLAQFIYEGISEVNSLNKTQKSVENTFDSKLHDDENH